MTMAFFESIYTTTNTLKCLKTVSLKSACFDDMRWKYLNKLAGLKMRQLSTSDQVS